MELMAESKLHNKVRCMSKAIVLDNNLKKSSEIELPKEYEQVNEHNLYLYVKSYMASLRANNAYAKNRGEVSGGGKKPWRQKKNGRARAGKCGFPDGQPDVGSD